MANVVLVDGNIGSGKTSLCAALARHASGGNNVAHVQEAAGPTLQRLFGAAPARYGFAMQLRMQAEREARLMTELVMRRTAPRAGLVLLDRSVVGDFAFAAYNYACGNLDADEWCAYQECVGGTGVVHAYMRAAHFTLPVYRPLVLYLNDPYTLCLRRARARNGPDAPTLQESYVCGSQYATVAAMPSAAVADAFVASLHAAAAAPVPQEESASGVEVRARHMCGLLPDEAVGARLLHALGYAQ